MKTFLLARVTALYLLFGLGHAHAQTRTPGIDVSRFQRDIDWAAVRDAGYRYAFAQATRGMTSPNPNFVANMNNGKAANVYMSAYHYAFPADSTPEVQADHFWDLAGSHILADGKSLMPMLDMEKWTGHTGASSYTDWANKWCDQIIARAAAAGVSVKPILYSSACAMRNFDSDISRFGAFVANYQKPDPDTGTPWSACSNYNHWNTWHFWQYSDTGTVPGITGACDRDMFNGSVDLLESTWIAKRIEGWAALLSSRRSDVNGDGKDDVVTFVRGGGNNAAGISDGDVYVALSNGTGCAGGGKWHEYFCSGSELPGTGDFNGDGKDDLVTFARGGRNNGPDITDGDVIVALSNGSGFGAGLKWNEYFCIGGELPAIGDVNGDGRDDIVVFSRGADDKTTGVTAGDVHVALSNGTSFGPGQKWHEFFTILGEFPSLGDFNGDNKDDLVTFVRGGGNSDKGVVDGNVYVALSNGAGFGASSLWHEFFSTGAEVPAIGDVNGDGKDDILTFVRGSADSAADERDGDVVVSLSNGTAFGAGAKWNDFSCVGDQIPGCADFNGDGKADIAVFTRGTSADVWITPSTGTGFSGGGKWHDWFAQGAELPSPASLLW